MHRSAEWPTLQLWRGCASSRPSTLVTDYRRIRIFLGRDGHRMGVDRAHRLWRVARLQVPRKRPRRRIASSRPRPTPPVGPNHVWAYDFVFDSCADGKQLKSLTVIDEVTRECLAIDVAGSIRSQRVIDVLSRLVSVHGAPSYLRSDNGPEFVSHAILKWIVDSGIGSAMARGSVATRSAAGARLPRRAHAEPAAAGRCIRAGCALARRPRRAGGAAAAACALHEAGRAAAVVESSASSSAVRTEAQWLVRVYEHVAAHFDVALRDGFGDAAADAPDPALREFTDWSTRAAFERERGFAAEATRNHARLVAFVHSPAFSGMALHDELLREIRFDVESSQAAQIGSFSAAVANATP